MKLLLALLFSLSLFANELLEQYRIQGIEPIQKQLDKELTSQEFWLQHLQDINTSFGYIESYNTILACDKNQSTLKLYIKDENASFNFKKEYAAFTGKISGDKQREGDLKTPVGIYSLTEKISKLDPFYGPLAFVTSYPNIYDTYRGKNGSGIWIHGLPQEDRDEFTRGCIAINNPNIECLDKRIDINNTLLIIDEKNYMPKVSKKVFASILSQLYKWRYAWIYNDLNSYLSFYDLSFKRKDGMQYERFKKYKTRIFNKQEFKSIHFSNLTIVPYPHSIDVYQISFKENYRSESYHFFGEKTLIISFEQNQFKILTEN